LYGTQFLGIQFFSWRVLEKALFKTQTKIGDVLAMGETEISITISARYKEEDYS